MKRLHRVEGILLIICAVLGAGGCAVYTDPGDAVIVAGAPPPPIAEAYITAPGPGFVWMGGYWGWTGGDWHWEAGRWARPPHAGAVWVRPHYYYHGGRHVWQHGHWR